jgi:hypothetical protein
MPRRPRDRFIRCTRVLPRMVATVAGAGLAGCSMVQPAVRPTAVRVADAGGDATRLAVLLEVANPGSTEIELVEYDYRLELADGASYAGRWAALRALPADGSIEAVIPAVVPAASARGGWRLTGTLSYRDTAALSRLLLDLGLIENRTSFSASGAQVEPAP